MNVVLNTSQSDLLNFTSRSESEPGQDVPATEMSFTELMDAFTPALESTLSNLTPNGSIADDLALLPHPSTALNVEPKGNQLAAFMQTTLNSSAQDAKSDGVKVQTLVPKTGGHSNFSDQNTLKINSAAVNETALPVEPIEGHQSRPAAETGVHGKSAHSDMTVPQSSLKDVPLPAATQAQTISKNAKVSSNITPAHTEVPALPVTPRDQPVQSVNGTQSVPQNEVLETIIDSKISFEGKASEVEPHTKQQTVSHNKISLPAIETSQAPSSEVNVKSASQSDASSNQKSIQSATDVRSTSRAPAATRLIQTVSLETASTLSSDNDVEAIIKTTADAPTKVNTRSVAENPGPKIPTFSSENTDIQTRLNTSSAEKQIDTVKSLNVAQTAVEPKSTPLQNLSQYATPPIQTEQTRTGFDTVKISYASSLPEAPNAAAPEMNVEIRKTKAKGEIQTPSFDELAADSFKPRTEPVAPKAVTQPNVSIGDVLKPAIETAPILFSTGSTPLETTTRLAPTVTATPLTQPSASQPAALQAVAQNLVHAYATQSGVSIRLDPPEMGNVLINFQFDADRGITAVVRSELAETSVFLKDRAEVLQQALRDSGFDSVNLRFEQGQTGSQHEQQSHQGFEGQYGLESEFTPSNTDDVSMLTLPRQNYLTTDDPIDLKL